MPMRHWLLGVAATLSGGVVAYAEVPPAPGLPETEESVTADDQVLADEQGSMEDSAPRTS